MHVIVKIPNGKHIDINLNENSTVSDLKSQISQLEDIPVDAQKLLYESRELLNDNVCNFNEFECIDLQLNLLGGIGPSDIPDHLKELANKYKVYKMICRKCYARLPQNAKNCRKRKCGHCANIRPKKKIKEKESKK